MNGVRSEGDQCMGGQYYMYLYVCVYIIVSIASIFLGSLV